MCFDWAKGKNQPRALGVPKKDGRARQEATIAEFLWQLEMLKREMTKGKKIAQHLAGGQESFACFS